MTTTQLSRRAFISTAVAAGGGLMLGFSIPFSSEAAAAIVSGEA